MITRIEKYKNYREEIKNKGELNFRINNGNKKIAHYKTKIDEFSPVVLKNIKIDNYLTIFKSLNNYNDEEKEVLDSLNSINYDVFEKTKNKIKSMYEEYNELASNQSINDDGDINEIWLSRNLGYVKCTEIIDKFDESKNKIAELNLSIGQNINESPINEDEMLKNISKEIELNDKDGIDYKKWYFVSFCVCLCLLVISFVIIFIDVV